MPSVHASQGSVCHSRNPVFSILVALFQQIVMVSAPFRIITVWVRVGERRPAGITDRPCLGTAPAEIRPVYVMIEKAFRLVLADDGQYVRPVAFRIVCATVKPDHKQITVAAAKFFNHAFAEMLIPLLTVSGKLSFSLYLEIMNAKKWVPPDTDIDPRHYIVFSTWIDKVADDIPLPVAPFYRFQAIRIDIALVNGKACLVGGRQDGKLGPRCFCRLYPLVRI